MMITCFSKFQGKPKKKSFTGKYCTELTGPVYNFYRDFLVSSLCDFLLIKRISSQCSCARHNPNEIKLFFRLICTKLLKNAVIFYAF